MIGTPSRRVSGPVPASAGDHAGLRSVTVAVPPGGTSTSKDSAWTRRRSVRDDGAVSVVVPTTRPSTSASIATGPTSAGTYRPNSTTTGTVPPAGAVTVSVASPAVQWI